MIKHLAEAWDAVFETPTQKLVALSLADVADQDGLVDLSANHIAARSNLTPDGLELVLEELKRQSWAVPTKDPDRWMIIGEPSDA